jgi:serine/threonine-protein kinase
MRTPSDKVAVIAIDEQSIANIGRWPWSREVHAKMIDKLTAAKAKVIGNTVFFFEPQIDPGLVYINKLTQTLSTSNLNTLTDPTVQQQVVQLNTILKEAEEQLNTDRKLAQSLTTVSNAA